MAYRKQVMEKGDHELFNHLRCFPFKDDVLFKPVLASTVCCSSLFCFFSTLYETDNEQLSVLGQEM